MGPLIPLLWPWFQNQGGSTHLCALLPVHNGIFRFTSSMTPADVWLADALPTELCRLSLRKCTSAYYLTELKNATIEERITLLETQMEIVNGAIADIEDDVDNLEGQVTVLFGDQVIQDEQLLELGTATESVYIHAFNNTSRCGHSFFAVC